MKIVSEKIEFATQGNSEIVEITDRVRERLQESGLRDGLVTVFVPGATGGVTTIEYEPGLVHDFQALLERVAPEDGEYAHNLTHEDHNGHAHVRASLVGPSLSIPFAEGKLRLGRWQQIIFVDCDNRPRQRSIVVQIMGQL